MTNKDLANLIFKDLKVSYNELLNMYPKRTLGDKAMVTRLAPSPTGFVHMGNVYAAFINIMMSKQTNGVSYLRIEDTDQLRYVDGGIERMIKDLKDIDLVFDEYPSNYTIDNGKYGPYIQSKRKEIYHAFVKHFIENNLAYPCFCTHDDLKHMREIQSKAKDRLGYYGKYAKCRSLTIDEVIERINNNIPYTIRFKSKGNYNNKIEINDLVKGVVVFPENDKDEVILKSSDGLPTYHFAHLADDILMRTTHVIRDHNWLPSTPLHIDLFNALGVKPLKYAHITPINKKDGDSVRKLSKRKDPEAAVSYYHEKGIPIEAVRIYIATIVNTNFEGWYEANSDKDISEFRFTFNKISTSGPLFDIEKLNNISRNYISKISAINLYDYVYKWSSEFDVEFKLLLEKYKDYSINILNIEREQKKPRKDFESFSNIKNQIWYMYDELFINPIYEWQNINDIKLIKEIIDIYFNNYYNELDSKEEWFSKIKLLCNDLGYATDIKDYKLNKDNYKGNITDITTVIRVALTTKSNTPDLYEIMRLLGINRINNRINLI